MVGSEMDFRLESHKWFRGWFRLNSWGFTDVLRLN